jgi:hypothetical protein
MAYSSGTAPRSAGDAAGKQRHALVARGQPGQRGNGERPEVRGFQQVRCDSAAVERRHSSRRCSAAGLPGREAALAFRLVYDYTLGFALADPTSPAEQRLRDPTLLRGLQADERLPGASGGS